MGSRRWVWEQYDSDVMADTIAGSGSDAALIRVHGTNRGIAVTTDCTPRYIKADPETGAMQAVAEAWRNITAIGATPIAITNNLNFGNPEKPRIMGQITGAITGMGKAAEVLATPVVSGNVSLYNETDGQAIDPAPVIGMVGSIDDIATAVGIAMPKGGETIFVIGQDETTADGWLGASVYADLLTPNPEAAPPPVNLDEEKRNGDFLRQQILAGQVTAAHDISDGGLLCAVTEMALASGGGAEINPARWRPYPWLVFW